MIEEEKKEEVDKKMDVGNEKESNRVEENKRERGGDGEQVGILGGGGAIDFFQLLSIPSSSISGAAYRRRLSPGKYHRHLLQLLRYTS